MGASDLLPDTGSGMNDGLQQRQQHGAPAPPQQPPPALARALAQAERQRQQQAAMQAAMQAAQQQQQVGHVSTRFSRDPRINHLGEALSSPLRRWRGPRWGVRQSLSHPRLLSWPTSGLAVSHTLVS